MSERINHIRRIAPLASPQEGGLPTDPVERCAVLMRRGQHLDSYRAWFEISDEVGDSAFRGAIRNVKPDQSLKYARTEPALPERDRYVLTNYPVLSSAPARKIILPEETDHITKRDVSRLKDEDITYDDLVDLTEDEGRRDIFFDRIDIQSPAQMLMTGLTTQEMGDLIKNALPHVDPDSRLLSFNVLIHPVKHTDLALDPVLAPHVKEEFVQRGLEDHLMQALMQRYFPSIEFLDLLFHEARDGKSAYGKRKVAHGMELPIDALLFDLLRRINKFRETPEDRGRNDYWLEPQEMDRAKDSVISYLLNDTYMQKVMQYVNSNMFYGYQNTEATLISPNAAGIETTSIQIAETGETAKQIKKRQFGEVLREAMAHLEKKGDMEILGKLKERRIVQTRFADFM